jgi:uncharacterized RDD family membrane protein YckC
MSGHDQFPANPFSAPESDLTPERFATDADPIRYATFGRRFAAAFLDGIITQVLSGVIGLGGGVIAGALIANAQTEEQARATSVGLGVGIQVLGMVIGWLYYALQESSAAQATLGKRALGLRVTDLEGRRISLARATGRFLAKIPSSLILLIGFLMQPFTAKKQALHDILAGTLVLKV